MIKNVVFDMGNVLMEYDPQRMLQRFAETEGDRALLNHHVFHSVEWVQCDRGVLSHQEAGEIIRCRIPNRLHPMLDSLLDHWFEEMRPIPETSALAQKLKTAGYGLYLLSNASSSFYRYYKNVPVLRLLDGRFISADWGLIKPEAEIYRAFHAHFGLVPSQCFFIDDFPLNIEASIRAGMPGHIFDGNMEALEAALRAAGVEWADSEETQFKAAAERQ